MSIQKIKISRVVQIAILVGAISFMTLTPLLWHTLGLDFRLIWLAGKVWTESASPYGPTFHADYLTKWGAGPPMHFWVYPPTWYEISRVMAEFSYQRAAYIWFALSIAMTVVGSVLIAKSFADVKEQAWTVTAFLAAIWLSHASLWNLSIGQTSAFALLGAGLLCIADKTESRAARVAGLMISLFKPNIGLFLVLFYAVQRRHWREVALVGVLTALLVAPLFATHQLGEFREFLDATKRYGDPKMWANDFSESTGVSQIVSFFGIYQSELIRSLTMIAAGLVAIALGLSDRRLPDGMGLPLLVAAILLFVPLHSYDQTLIAVPIGYALFKGGQVQETVLAALLVTRSLTSAKLTHIRNLHAKVFYDSPLYLLAGLIVVVAILQMQSAGGDRSSDNRASDSDVLLRVTRLAKARIRSAWGAVRQ